MRFGFFLKPPVDNAGLAGDFEVVRDRDPEPSVCAGETPLGRGAGGSWMGCNGGIILVACSFSATFLAAEAFFVVLLDVDDFRLEKSSSWVSGVARF
jgi:hypothetical protein